MRTPINYWTALLLLTSVSWAQQGDGDGAGTSQQLPDRQHYRRGTITHPGPLPELPLAHTQERAPVEPVNDETIESSSMGLKEAINAARGSFGIEQDTETPFQSLPNETFHAMPGGDTPPRDRAFYESYFPKYQEFLANVLEEANRGIVFRSDPDLMSGPDTFVRLFDEIRKDFQAKRDSFSSYTPIDYAANYTFYRDNVRKLLAIWNVFLSSGLLPKKTLQAIEKASVTGDTNGINALIKANQATLVKNIKFYAKWLNFIQEMFREQRESLLKARAQLEKSAREGRNPAGLSDPVSGVTGQSLHDSTFGDTEAEGIETGAVRALADTLRRLPTVASSSPAATEASTSPRGLHPMQSMRNLIKGSGPKDTPE